METKQNWQPSSDDIEKAQKRRSAFLSALPESMVQKEDQLPRTLSLFNASTHSKLNHIYRLVDELSEIRAPYVACRKGCSVCCYMNITLTSVEAERLGMTVGRQPVEIKKTIRHPLTKFQGQACPFIDKEGGCSIYANRPLACRKHVSFFEDDAACHALNEIEVPMLSFSGLDAALIEVSTPKGQLVLADIRDFFPPENPK